MGSGDHCTTLWLPLNYTLWLRWWMLHTIYFIIKKKLVKEKKPWTTYNNKLWFLVYTSVGHLEFGSSRLVLKLWFGSWYVPCFSNSLDQQLPEHHLLKRKAEMLKGKFYCTGTFQTFAGITTTDMSLIKQVIWPNPNFRSREVPSVCPEAMAKVWMHTTTRGKWLGTNNLVYHRDMWNTLNFFQKH